MPEVSTMTDPKDLLWTLGVAILIYAIWTAAEAVDLVNRLLKRASEATHE